MRKFLLFYQKFISPLKPPCCRFYPTCSNYALWQSGRNGFWRTFFSTAFRILRCNPLVRGGIDYPTTRIEPARFGFVARAVRVAFWFVPREARGRDFFLIKGL